MHGTSRLCPCRHFLSQTFIPIWHIFKPVYTVNLSECNIMQTPAETGRLQSIVALTCHSLVTYLNCSIWRVGDVSLHPVQSLWAVSFTIIQTPFFELEIVNVFRNPFAMSAGFEPTKRLKQPTCCRSLGRSHGTCCWFVCYNIGFSAVCVFQFECPISKPIIRTGSALYTKIPLCSSWTLCSEADPGLRMRVGLQGLIFFRSQNAVYEFWRICVCHAW